MAEKTSAISVRVTDEVKAAVQKAAAADDRSVSRYIERLLTGHLREAGYLDDGGSKYNLETMAS